MPFCQQDRTFAPVRWTFSSLAPSIFCSRTSAIRRKVIGANYDSLLCNPAELAFVDFFVSLDLFCFLQTISVFLKREHSKLLSDLHSIHILKKRLRISSLSKLKKNKKNEKKDLGFPSLSKKMTKKKT